MGARNHTHRRLRILSVSFTAFTANSVHTAKKLGLQAHRIEGIGDLIVVRLDLAWKRANVSGCSVENLRGCATLSLRPSFNLGRIRLTLGNLLESLVSHDCEKVAGRSLAPGR